MITFNSHPKSGNLENVNGLKRRINPPLQTKQGSALAPSVSDQFKASSIRFGNDIQPRQEWVYAEHPDWPKVDVENPALLTKETLAKLEFLRGLGKFSEEELLGQEIASRLDEVSLKANESQPFYRELAPWEDNWTRSVFADALDRLDESEMEEYQRIVFTPEELAEMEALMAEIGPALAEAFSNMRSSTFTHISRTDGRQTTLHYRGKDLERLEEAGLEPKDVFENPELSERFPPTHIETDYPQTSDASRGDSTTQLRLSPAAREKGPFKAGKRIALSSLKIVQRFLDNLFKGFKPNS